jgi:adenine phosphoribosyltransferase
MSEEFYTIEICGLTRNLPLFEVAPKVRIAIFNMLGDTEVVEAIADELAVRMPQDADALMTAEVKSIPLAHAMAVRMGLPYIVARKTRKPYMVGAMSVEVLSITTGAPQLLWLDGKDLGLVRGKRIILVDDVISTGSTLAGMRKLVDEAGGAVIAEAAAFTEGNESDKWQHIIATGNLPVFLGQNDPG